MQECNGQCQSYGQVPDHGHRHSYRLDMSIAVAQEHPRKSKRRALGWAGLGWARRKKHWYGTPELGNPGIP